MYDPQISATHPTHSVDAAVPSVESSSALPTVGESLLAPTRNFTKLGLGLMLLAAVLWAPLPVLPFLALSAGVKVAIGTTLFVAVQIAWWGGTVLAGPAAVRQVYALFRKLQWWKKITPGE